MKQKSRNNRIKVFAVGASIIISGLIFVVLLNKKGIFIGKLALSRDISTTKNNEDVGNALSEEGVLTEEEISDFNEDGKLQKLRSYTYDAAVIDPSFTVYYPFEMEESLSDTAGTWDITLTNKDQKIEIDLSGQKDKDFEPSLKDWINGFGENTYDFQSTLIEEGINTNGSHSRKFKIYEVTVEDEKYIYALVDVAEVNGGNGYLAVRATNLKDLKTVREIVESIN